VPLVMTYLAAALLHLLRYEAVGAAHGRVHVQRESAYVLDRLDQRL